MEDEALQVAFEIKILCDELSRRLLRWHWEQKPGPHTLDALLRYVAQRQKESPEYYDRMPDPMAKTSWQQLDTTFCMRVLLDPEKDAAQPVDLLGNTARPAAARRACNALRMARNQAAHAADRKEGIQAAILFNDAVESLEEGYAGSALKESELAKYYRQAEEFLQRCGAKEPVAQPQKAARSTSAGASKGAAAKTGKTASGQNRISGKTTASRKTGKHTASGRKKKPSKRSNSGVGWLLFAVLVAGLLVRAYSMGLI